MPKSSKATPTPDEIFSALKKTTLTTIIVEGKDDIIVYRKIESLFHDRLISVLPVGGRDIALDFYKKRKHLPSNVKFLFIVDKDMWSITKTPPEYISETLFITDGYSIENDAIRDLNIESYMSISEKSRLTIEIDLITRWYATNVCEILDGKEACIKTHPNQIFDGSIHIKDEAELTENEKKIYDLITSNPYKLLRGKTLMALILRQLSYPGRIAKHNDKSLLDTAGSRRGPLLSSLFDQIVLAVS